MEKQVHYEIGFADSEIISYKSEGENLIIFLKAWNEEILRIEFSSCILFIILNSWLVSDLCEIDSTDLFQQALRTVYGKVPSEHPYKLFQFYDLDGDPSLQVGCKNINITRV